MIRLMLLSLVLFNLLGCAINQQDQEKIKEIPRVCGLDLSLSLYYYPNQISIIGSFNDFQSGIHTMYYDESDQSWRFQLSLNPGLYLYAFEIDGQLQKDDHQPQSAFRDGIEYSLIEVEDCTLGKWGMIHREYAKKDGLTFPIFTLKYEQGSVTISPKWRIKFLKNHIEQPIQKEIDHQEFTKINTMDFIQEAGKYELLIEDIENHAIPLRASFWVEEDLFSWKDALVYQVVVDRFVIPDPVTYQPSDISLRLGGTLAGVLEKLDEGYFDRLGVKALWLSPLYPNAIGLWRGVEGGERKYEGYHGYWPIQARAVGEEWGGASLLKAVVEKAHQKGIRVLADIVLNHVHQNHAYFQAHPDWFSTQCICGFSDCSWADHIQTCQFTPYLPDVNYWGQSEVLFQFTEDALWWIETFDLDGLRLDAIPMMPRAVIRRLVKRVHDRFEVLGNRHYLIGENFTGPNQRNQIRQALGANGLEGQFDFPLLWAIRSSFAEESQSLIELVRQVKLSQEAWDKSDGFMGNFIGNHDMQRFMLSAVQFDDQYPKSDFNAWVNPPTQPDFELPYLKQWLAQAFAYVMEGTPFLFYGDEIALIGLSDPDNRRPMIWDDRLLNPYQIALRQKLEWLGQLRKCVGAFRRGKIQWLALSDERIALIKGEGQESVLIIFNRKTDLLPWDLSIPPSFQGIDWQRVPQNDLRGDVDLFSMKSQEIDDQRSVLKFNPSVPYSLEIYLPKNHFCIMQP